MFDDIIEKKQEYIFYVSPMESIYPLKRMKTDGKYHYYNQEDKYEWAYGGIVKLEKDNDMP